MAMRLNSVGRKYTFHVSPIVCGWQHILCNAQDVPNYEVRLNRGRKITGRTRSCSWGGTSLLFLSPPSSSLCPLSSFKHPLPHSHPSHFISLPFFSPPSFHFPPINSAIEGLGSSVSSSVRVRGAWPDCAPASATVEDYTSYPQFIRADTAPGQPGTLPRYSPRKRDKHHVFAPVPFRGLFWFLKWKYNNRINRFHKSVKWKWNVLRAGNLSPNITPCPRRLWVYNCSCVIGLY